MTRMNDLLGERACDLHPDAPIPCLECAGAKSSELDLKRGGYRGRSSTFEDHNPGADEKKRDVEVASIVREWFPRSAMLPGGAGI